MATVTEMREWLRAEGADVPERGRLRPELISLYEQAHPEPAELSDGGISTADFDVLPDELEPSVPMEPERRPRTQRQMRADAKPKRRTLADRLLGTPGDKPKAAGKGKPRGKILPRIPVDGFVGRVYAGLGRVLTPISPATSRCIQVQGPMAGVILEDTVKGTIVDRFLQPAVRAEDKARKVFPLFACPLACFTIEYTSQMEPTPAVMFRQGLAIELLREGLRTGLQVTEQYAEQIAARMERDAATEGEVDKLIALIFPPQPVPQPEPEMAGAAA